MNIGDMNIRSAVRYAVGQIRAARVVVASGMIPLTHPGLAVASARDMRDFGPVAGALRVAARRHGDRTALVDDSRTLTYAELASRAEYVAAALKDAGHGEGTMIAVLCRDGCAMVEAMMGVARAGAGLVLMNTSMSAVELRDVCRREGVGLLIHDAEFSAAVAEVEAETLVVGGKRDGLATLVERGAQLARPGRPGSPGRLVLLTGGTTGTPKGAPRTVRSPLVAAQFLDRIPLPYRGTTLVAAPLFHGTGLSQFLLSVALGTTNVLMHEFDPEQTLRLIDRHRCTTVVLVPTMLNRILALGAEVLDRYDTSSVSIIFCSGSALPTAVAEEAERAFGPVVYNLYGSSEVGVAAVATPEDLRTAPGTVGRPPATAVVRLYDQDDRLVQGPDSSGTIYVGGLLSFAGYSGGGHKKSLDGLLSSGDVGHWDTGGRLFVDGRDDDMVVSGGENVFPGEIEDLLYAHPDIDDAAIAPVPDDDFGQRLAAYLVLRPGGELDAEAVREYVKAHLARYKVPRDVVFMDELPRTPSGKLLRRHLGRPTG